MMKRALPALLFVLLVLLSPLVAAGAPSARPGGVRVLYYSSGVFQRVLRNRTNPAFARTGDYVKGMKLRPDATCMVAVNYNSRGWLAQNLILVVDIYNPVRRVWQRERCQPIDHQQKRHSTGDVQRLEVSWEVAKRAQFTRDGVTTARLIRIER